MRFPGFAIVPLGFWLSLACLPAPARASAVVIWPVDPVIKGGEQATALWLENKGEAPVTLQVRTFGWSQPAGEDKLDQQQQVVASPPIAVVAPGARQLVRLIRRSTDAAPEKAYRLLIDELPPPPGAQQPGMVQARLTVQMRYSIPLFTYAAASAPPQLVASVAAGPGGRVLTIRNTGAGHARLTDLRLIATGGREIVVRAGLAGYVLAGGTIAIPLPDGQVGSVRVGVNGADQVLGNRA